MDQNRPNTISVLQPQPLALSMLIDGAPAPGGDRLEVFNPADPTELVGTIPRGTPSDVAAAVAAAKRAQVSWGAMSFTERASVLGLALEKLSNGIEERAVLLVRENGKVLAEAMGELSGVSVRQKLALDLAPILDEGRALVGQNGDTFVSYRPYGVVVSIVPWNAPISLGFGQIIAALLAGNGLVIKPPETSPLALMASIQLLTDGLPKGLVNIVTGLPGEIGDALTTHPDVAKIAFTGSIPAARRIMANAVETIKSLTLELGGNDAAILLPDVALSDATMKRMVRSVFRMSGQICMAIKRIYVPEGIERKFTAAFSSVANQIVVGNGLNSGVSMGPMHTAKALERAKNLVSDARDKGGEVCQLGKIEPAAVGAAGYFMQPTVVTGIPDTAALMSEEQFAPALPIASYRDVDDAIERANRSVFGLGGSVWGSDVIRAGDIARRLEAGTIFVNAHGTEAINRNAPYGGMKQSGLGRKSGLDGILEYTDLQTLTIFDG